MDFHGLRLYIAALSVMILFILSLNYGNLRDLRGRLFNIPNPFRK